MSKPHFKRRHIFINKVVQVRFILGAFLVILLSSLCSSLLIYWITGGDLQAQSHSAHVNIAHSEERLILSILISNVVAILITGGISLYAVLHATHKIVGPLYRFEKNCEQIGSGNLDAYTLVRENDHFQGLGLAFTNMVDKLRAKKLEQQELADKITAQAELLKQGQNLTGQQVSELKEIARLLKQL